MRAVGMRGSSRIGGTRKRNAVSNVKGLSYCRPTAEHIYFMLRVIRRGSPSAEAATP